MRAGAERGSAVLSSRAPALTYACSGLLAAALVGLPGAARAGLPSGAGTGLTEGDKLISIFQGVALGLDTNVRRASTGAEEDIVTQILVGASFAAGGQRSRFDLQAQYRQDSYAELSDLDFDETQVMLAAFAGTDRFRIRFLGAYETLVDPTDVEVVELLERTRISCAPGVDFEFGAVGLGFGYSSKGLDYADPLYDKLDLEQEVWTGELRWILRQTRQVFVHYEVGDVDYLSALTHNFEWQRCYLGVRTESPRKSGFEIALGVDMIDKYGVTAEPYALVRGTAVLGGGRSIVDALASHGTEAAVDADFKRATRLMVRYTRKAGSRLGLTVSVSGENDDLHRTTRLSDPLRLVSVDAGLNLEIGSPGKVHGRLYLTFGHESRTAPAAADEYDRLRLLAGVALVY